MRTFAALVRKFAPWMPVVFLLLVVQTQGHADTASATLTLEITDTSGAVIQDASVAVRDVSTNQEQRSHSGKSGMTTFPFLRPGVYALVVSKQGFAEVSVDNILLNVGDQKNLQLTLKVGSATQIVTVDGTGVTINTTDGSVSTVIDQQFVKNAPLNGRSFQDLINMTPGVVTQSPQAGTSVGLNGDFSVNGQRTGSNYYLVDGVAANTSAGNGFGTQGPGTSGTLANSTALGTTQSLISVDALQEFQVQSSSYSAEFGRTPGGQFSFATRSGTNEFHGSAFDYLRNNLFDANNWFNDHYDASKSALRQNDFGGTLGGPVWIPRAFNGKSRTFFFVSYEGLRLTQPQAASIQYVPDTYLRRQAPAALQPILNAYPIQNGVDYGNSTSPSLAEFIEPYSLLSQIDSTSVRIDDDIMPKLHLFFRAGYTPSVAQSRNLSSLWHQSFETTTYTLGATGQLTAKAANELRLGYSRVNTSNVGTLDNFGGAQPISLAQALGTGSYPSPESDFYISAPGAGSAELFVPSSGNGGRQWNLVDTFNLSLRGHQLRFGIDYRRIASPTIEPSPYVAAALLSSSSVLNNSVDSLYVEQALNSTPLFEETGVFAQDEWRASSRLNLSLGVRWEINPAPTEAHGNDAYTVLGNFSDPSSLTLAPRGTPLWKTSWYNFAPRLGGAWVVRPNRGWQTVARTGVGIFFDTDNEQGATGFGGIGFVAQQILVNAALPLTSAQLDFSPSATAPYTNSTVYAYPRHLQLPYTIEWNVSMEQGMGESQAFTLSYVGSNGRRLLQLRELSLSSLNPDFGTVVLFPTGPTSSYQAMQLKFQRSVGRGVHALASYTWSHSIDFGSNGLSLPVTRGDSDFDVRSSFSAALSWDMPRQSAGKAIDLISNSWALDGRLTARTAFPVSLQGNYITDPATGSQYYGNLDLVPDQPIYLYGAQYPGGHALNPAAFQMPADSNSPGTAPRNFVRGFGAVQVNLALRREFRLYENILLQFRAESFNILNHPNFGYVDPTVTDATFGQATKTLNQSLGTVASQYQQGGPRSMQFAFKVMF